MSAWAPGTRKCNEENDSTPSLSLKVPCRSEATSSGEDRKSTRLNSSHSQISYAVFCLKKKNNRIAKAMGTLLASYGRLTCTSYGALKDVTCIRPVAGLFELSTRRLRVSILQCGGSHWV